MSVVAASAVSKFARSARPGAEPASTTNEDAPSPNVERVHVSVTVLPAALPPSPTGAGGAATAGSERTDASSDVRTAQPTSVSALGVRQDHESTVAPRRVGVGDGAVTT